MYSIAETSSLSKISESISSIPLSEINKLEAIEDLVAQKLVSLHDQKISKMSRLSDLIDQRSQLEGQLIKRIESSRIKQKQFAAQEQCRQVFKKYQMLKDKEQQIKSKISSNPQNKIVHDDSAIQNIQEIRNKNILLRKQIDRIKQNPKQKITLNELKSDIQELYVYANNLQMNQSLDEKIQSINENPRMSIKQLLEYIEEEQKNKKLLYEEIVDFQTEMQQLRVQNEEMRRILRDS